MIKKSLSIGQLWRRVGIKYLPFADVATPDLPIGRLLRLSLFQVTVGMAMVLLNGTLNRVMIVELGVPAWLVATMVALPLVFAPLRVLIGFRSDHHKSFLGLRRIPYIWMGTLLQFGGFGIMPFAMLVLSGKGIGPWGEIAGPAGAALAFLLVGAGMHTVQTAGLALATDLAAEESRPRVVALFYVMLLVGMVVSSLTFGVLLEEFSPTQLVQVVQGAAAVTMALNLIALWKQEARNPDLTDPRKERPSFFESWRTFSAGGASSRLLVAVGLGTAGFTMQDILLEPYGGEVLSLSVSETTQLTALLATGMLVSYAFAARRLSRGADPCRLSALGVLIGIVAFATVIFAAPLESPLLFRVGTTLIGLGGGLFAVGTLTAAMGLARSGQSGLALGAWGAVQATATGGAVALGGAIRDVMSGFVADGAFGPTIAGPAASYGMVYHLEIVLLIVTLFVIVPLARRARADRSQTGTKLGLAEFPG